MFTIFVGEDQEWYRSDTENVHLYSIYWKLDSTKILKNIGVHV